MRWHVACIQGAPSGGLCWGWSPLPLNRPTPAAGALFRQQDLQHPGSHVPGPGCLRSAAAPPAGGTDRRGTCWWQPTFGGGTASFKEQPAPPGAAAGGAAAGQQCGHGYLGPGQPLRPGLLAPPHCASRPLGCSGGGCQPGHGSGSSAYRWRSGSTVAGGAAPAAASWRRLGCSRPHPAARAAHCQPGVPGRSLAGPLCRRQRLLRGPAAAAVHIGSGFCQHGGLPRLGTAGAAGGGGQGDFGRAAAAAGSCASRPAHRLGADATGSTAVAAAQPAGCGIGWQPATACGDAFAPGAATAHICPLRGITAGVGAAAGAAAAATMGAAALRAWQRQQPWEQSWRPRGAA